MKNIVLYSLLLLTVDQIKTSDKKETPQSQKNNEQKPVASRPENPYAQYPGNSPQAVAAPTSTSSDTSQNTEEKSPERFPGKK